MSYVWGVDSAVNVTEDVYNCVLNNFGKPMFWGRYLTTVPNASEGLTQTEIRLLHNSGTKILPIYNKFTKSTGKRQGRVVAQNAVFHAKRLGIPKGTFLFANVEKEFEVDAAWILGYVEALYPSGYKPGFYNDPKTGNFRSAYCKAVSQNKLIAEQAVLWSAEPEPGVTKKAKAPTFRPSKPSCQANVWAWQYGRGATQCPVDTNLIDQRLQNELW
ncbi:DUF1906 domain-containing protein [Aquibacillus sp. 3ASR75-11]|uniref:DUF1906 domain-containing protein n=1 Tax=Terrihalobacillus insolitus TaxID=2950438 RepID=A0A9X3WR81_9BACI|nr:glycoside hydrolase domain-containing protein [Terrihalobacillus insolitus]MDC3412698.1 DUF1906 domain-containing protein [Terrihalobacillus insolitus]MDC3423825.1 DUF1906 domain-containing protein [Terrihalobacillus insolitus]